MNTTHLALSEPGGAPVTADETSPLSRRRKRGLFIRQGERERARNELTAGVEEVAQAVEPSEEATVDKTGTPSKASTDTTETRSPKKNIEEQKNKPQ